MKKIILFLLVFLLLGAATGVSAHMPRIVYYKDGDITINEPEVSQAFYDELKGEPRNYFINSGSDFDLYLNLLVPSPKNYNGRYSADVFSIKDGKEELIFSLPTSSVAWQDFYEPFGRDYYLKGPEIDKNLPSGNYKIKVFSGDNSGRYVLAVGKKEVFTLPEILNIFWQLPLLKVKFFETSVVQFFFTPFFIWAFIGAIILFFAIWLVAYLIKLTRKTIMSNLTKTVVLTSAGMQVKEEILKLLSKPPDSITVAHIITASKAEEDTSYLEKDKELMKQAGFNVQDIDIEGKNEKQLMEELRQKDIIYVQGGNTFYLMKQIRMTGFDKVVKKLLRKGIMYVGVSAGSIVAGETIETANLLPDEWSKNRVNLKNLKGMNLVPYNIFVHYQPEYAEIIKQKIPNLKKRNRLKILTDDQALIIQGENTLFVGVGEETDPAKI